MAYSEIDSKFEEWTKYNLYLMPSPKEDVEVLISKVTRVKQLAESPKYNLYLPRMKRKTGANKISARNRYEDYDITPSEKYLNVIIMELMNQLEIMDRVGGFPRKSKKVMEALYYLHHVPLLTLMVEDMNQEMFKVGIVDKIFVQLEDELKIRPRRRKKEKETSHTPKELNNGASEKTKTSASCCLTWCKYREIRYFLQRQGKTKAINQIVF